MDKKRTCHSKNPDDPSNPSESNKSVTGLYYGKLSNLIAKKKIKCIYEPLEDYTESTGSLVDSESNIGKTSGKPFEVKIFSNEEASPNRSFFNQGDLSKGCIKPSSGSGNSENLGVAIGLQIPAQGQSKNLTVVVEFDAVEGSSTSLTELKKYTSRMKLSEETPSKMIFNGIVKLQPRAQPFEITSVPLYIIDPEEKIVENPGFSVSYKTSAKPGKDLVVEKPTDVLVKLKVDKPSGEGGRPKSSTAKKDCSCNKTKKTTISDILLCRKHKSNDSINGAPKCAPRRESSTCDKKSCDKNENPAKPAFGTCGCETTNENAETDGENPEPTQRAGSCVCKKTDEKTETNGKVDAGTQSTANLQASQSNQTPSQVSVSSGKDLQSKSNQTNMEDETTKSQSKNIGAKSSVTIKEPQKSMTTMNVQSVQVVDDNKSKFDVSESKKSETDLTRRESKNQQKRREGWDRLEKRRSKEDQKLTSRNPDSTLRNTTTQSSINRIAANKEISAQYSFVQPNYGFFANLADSSSTITDSLIPVKSTQIDKVDPLSIASTSTQWPQSLSSSEDRSQATLTLLSDVTDDDKMENTLTVPTNTPSYSESDGVPLSQDMAINFSTQTDLNQTPKKVNTYSQYMSYPIENEIISLKLDESQHRNHDIKTSPETLILLERAKFKLGEYAENQRSPYATTHVSIGEVASIFENEEGEDLKSSNSTPQYVDKEIDASQREKRQSMFSRFIKHLKPPEVPVTIAQYHTICSTTTPFQLKSIPCLHDLQTEAKGNNSFNPAKFELELKTIEIDKVNSKLGEEIDSLQKIYDDLYTNVSFIYDNQDIFPIPPVTQNDTKNRSIKNIKSDISQTFIELNGCLSTIDKILSTASLKSVYETPPCTASTSKEDGVTVNDAQHEDIHSNEIQTTYMTVENDIKKTIKELLKESEYIKHQALLNGASEEPEPPFFFEYFDYLKEANPLLICKSIVDDLSSKYDSTTRQDERERKPKRFRQEEKEKVSGSKKSIGSCSRIKTDVDGSNNKKDVKLKIDNKKNDRITYFCTTFVSKIPKTSFSFGGNSRALHRETRRIHKKENAADNVTSGDNAKLHEEDDEVFCKSWLPNIMEPNLNTKNLINEKSGDLDLKKKVDDENYEINVSYANYLAYLNATNGANDSVQDKNNVEEKEKDTLISNLLEGCMINEVNVLQMQESVLTNDSSNFGSGNSSVDTVASDPKSQEQKKEIPAQQGAILKSPKSVLLAESFNRGNNLPSTSTTVYKRTETTDEEEVIREMDLTKETLKMTEATSNELLGAKEYQSNRWHQEQTHKKSFFFGESNPTTSSDEYVVKRNPPKYIKRSKDLKVITVKPKPEKNVDSDSDETVLKLMQQQNYPTNNYMLPGSSNVLLRSTRANTNVCLQHSGNPPSPASVLTGREESSLLSIGNDRKLSANETDYDGDSEQMTTSLPVRVFKSKPEMNSPEEIARIEENVRQNEMLERRNLRLFFQSVSSESLYDDYSSTVTNPLLSDYSLSDSSPEMYSSGNNN